MTDRSILNDEVVMKKMNNKIRAISHEAGQYDSFHFTTAIFDEIGEVTNREKISKIVSGQVMVENHQFVQISTSYPDPSVPFRKDQKTLQEAMEKDWDREADTSLCLGVEFYSKIFNARVSMYFYIFMLLLFKFFHCSSDTIHCVSTSDQKAHDLLFILVVHVLIKMLLDKKFIDLFSFNIP